MTDQRINYADIVARQRAYFESGATLPYGARHQALKSLRQGLQQYEPRLLAALREDLGKSATESMMTEIGQVAQAIKHTLRHLRRWMRPQRVAPSLSDFPSSQRIVPHPYGVVLVVAPWNYPVNLTLMPLVGALAAGNCCIVKPSELSPATTHVMAEMLEELFPEELVCTLQGDAQVSQALLALHFDYIFYTGSTSVGRIVMAQAARHLTPVTLELGGKSPVIVARSAPLRLAAKRIAFGKWLNAGQTCVAPDYILVEAPVHDELVRLLMEETTQLYGAMPLEHPDYGRIINRRHYDRLCRLMMPAKTVMGGDTDPHTLQIAPTLLDGVLPTDPVMQEEIFGPLLPILTVADIDEACAMVRQRPHPLALYLFAKDKKVEQQVMGGLQYGGGCVNDVVMHIAAEHLPFGGVGMSGMGTYHGKHSFGTFSHPKSILSRGTWLDPAVRYPPYTRAKYRLIRWLTS